MGPLYPWIQLSELVLREEGGETDLHSHMRSSAVQVHRTHQSTVPELLLRKFDKVQSLHWPPKLVGATIQHLSANAQQNMQQESKLLVYNWNVAWRQNETHHQKSATFASCKVPRYTQAYVVIRSSITQHWIALLNVELQSTGADFHS